MKLNPDQIRAVTCGAVSVTEQEGMVFFHRFSDAQERLYDAQSEYLGRVARCTSGIQLRFRTDSRTLRIAVQTAPGCSRAFFSLDVFADGKQIGVIRNFDLDTMQGVYAARPYPLGDFEEAFELGEGEKEVRLVFPWSVRTALRELELEDGSFVTAVKPAHRLLAFGDSITQGYDVCFTANRYAARLAEALNAEEYNRAVGGEVFRPGLVEAEAADGFRPDWITVAYGTNDWEKLEQPVFRQNAEAFLQKLTARYPETDVLVITPIWRQDYETEHTFGAFSDTAEILKKLTAPYEKVRLLEGFDLIPQELRFFGDLRVHPNDAGNAIYAEKLLAELRPSAGKTGR